jgi:hypothetical protein
MPSERRRIFLARRLPEMLKPMRVMILGLLIALAAPSVLVPTQAAAQSGQIGLHLRKTKYFIDDKGPVWVSAQFVNDDNRSINIAGVAPTRVGPWTAIDKKLEPGATVRGAVKVLNDGVIVVWVSSSQGLLRFELPSRR